MRYKYAVLTEHAKKKLLLTKCQYRHAAEQDEQDQYHQDKGPMPWSPTAARIEEKIENEGCPCLTEDRMKVYLKFILSK